MADGSVVIDVSLDSKHVKSDTKLINDILKSLGKGAGGTMEQSVSKNAAEMKKSVENAAGSARSTLEKAHSAAKRTLDNPINIKLEAKNETGHAVESAKKDVGSVPKEKSISFLGKDHVSGEAKKAAAEANRVPKSQETKFEASDHVSSAARRAKRETESVPKSRRVILAAKDRVSSVLGHIRSGFKSTAKTAHGFHDVLAGTFVANAASGFFSSMKNGFLGLIHTGLQYNSLQSKMGAVWNTLTDSASKGKKMVKSINGMSTAFGQSTDLVNELDQQFYHVFDNQPRTERLTKSVLTLADTLGMTSDDVSRLGLNFTHMLSSGKMQLGDFNMITDQLPMYASKMLDYERKVQHNGSLTMSQLRKQMSAGKISAKDAETVMEELGQKYKKATKNMMSTPQGMWRSIQSNFSRLSGYFVKGLFNFNKSGIEKMNKWLSSNAANKYFENAGRQVAKFFNKIQKVVEYISDHRKTIINFAKAFLTLSAAMWTINKVAAAVTIIRRIIKATKDWTVAQTVLDAVFIANPIGAFIAIIVALGVAFYVTYKKCKPFRDFINWIGKGIKNALKWMKNFAKGVGDLFAGKTKKGSNILESIMPKDTAKQIEFRIKSIRNSFGSLAKGIKNYGKSMAAGWNYITKGSKSNLSKLGKDFKNYGKSMVSGWNYITKGTSSNWSKVKKSTSKSWGSIKSNISNSAKSAGKNVSKHWSDIKNGTASKFNSARKSADSHWKNIKSTVGNAAKSARNNVSKHWSAIKSGTASKFNSARKSASTHWSHIKSSVSDAAKSARNNVSKHWSAIKSGTSSKFNSARKTAASRWKSIKSTISDSAKSARNNVGDRWDDIKHWTSSKFNDARKTTSSKWHDIRDSVSSLAKSAKNRASDSWSSLKSRTSDIFGSIRKNTSSHWGDIRKSMSSAASHAKNSVLKGWDNLKSGTSHLFARIANSIVGGIGKGVNGAINGINWVLKRVHVHKIATWHVPHFATGGKAHGLSIVGETGKPELIKHADGKVEMSPNHATLYNFEQPVDILGADKTDQLMKQGYIHAYSVGTWIGNAVDFIKGGFAKVKAAGSDLWQFARQPLKLINTVITRFTDLSGLKGTILDMATGTVKTIAKASANYVKSLINDATISGSHSSAEVAKWIRQALDITHESEGWLPYLVTIAMHESGGNPSAVNRWDINAKLGHPSIGLMQTIGPTFERYKLPGHDNIRNPVDNAIAAIRYIVARYGSITNVPGIRAMAAGGVYRGYATGTNNSVGGRVIVGEKEPEIVQTKDGRVGIVERPTAFENFMAGSKITPLSNIPQFAEGTADLEGFLSHVSMPQIITPALYQNGHVGQTTHAERPIKVSVYPQTIYQNLDGRTLTKTVVHWQKVDQRNINIAKGVLEVNGE